MEKILLVLLIGSLTDIHAQKPAEFIRQYHEHIDPLGKLDTIQVMVIQMKSEISAVINSNIYNKNRSMTCSYYSNGKAEFWDNTDGKPMNLENFMPPSSEPKKNPIKACLNYISVDDEDSLSFRIVNDSITVIEKKLKDETFFVYTFDNNTKNLLRIENNRSNSAQKFVSHTNFLSHQIVNGILVSKKVAYSNDFTEATLEYVSVEFR